MISNAIVMTLLILAGCVLVGSCVALLVLVVEMAREAVGMVADRLRVRSGDAHRHARRGIA